MGGPSVRAVVTSSCQGALRGTVPACRWIPCWDNGRAHGLSLGWGQIWSQVTMILRLSSKLRLGFRYNVLR